MAALGMRVPTMRHNSFLFGSASLHVYQRCRRRVCVVGTADHYLNFRSVHRVILCAFCSGDHDGPHDHAFPSTINRSTTTLHLSTPVLHPPNIDRVVLVSASPIWSIVRCCLVDDRLSPFCLFYSLMFLVQLLFLCRMSCVFCALF